MGDMQVGRGIVILVVSVCAYAGVRLATLIITRKPAAARTAGWITLLLLVGIFWAIWGPRLGK